MGRGKGKVTGDRKRETRGKRKEQGERLEVQDTGFRLQESGHKIRKFRENAIRNGISKAQNSKPGTRNPKRVTLNATTASRERAS